MRIYLASPYSHADAKVRELRYRKAVLYTGLLFTAGHHVFSPIVHCHPVALEHELPGDHEYWRAYNKSFINWCEVLVILKLDGWDVSRGIIDEKQIAMTEILRPFIHWDPAHRLPDLVGL